MPATPLTATQIIANFEEYTDDTSDLSQAQELALANKIYRKILTNRTWIFLIKPYAGTAAIDANGRYYVMLPSDFSYIPVTSGYTDTGEYGLDKTLLVGPNFQPYKMVNYTDRNRYHNVAGFCYLDMPNNRIVFTDTTLPYTDVYFDYVYTPDDMGLNDSPVFPSDFHQMIQHGMAVDGYIIQIFEKDRAYTNEHMAIFQDYFDDMDVWNAQFYAQ